MHRSPRARALLGAALLSTLVVPLQAGAADTSLTLAWTPGEPPGGQELRLEAPAQGPGGPWSGWTWTLAGSIATGRLVNLTAPARGSWELVLHAQDAAGSWHRSSATLLVANAPPVVTLAQRAAVLVNRTLVLPVETADADGDPVHLRLLEAPHGASLESPGLEWRPGPDQVGEHRVLLRASDGLDETETSLTVTVLPNAPPVPVLDGALTLQPGHPARFDAGASFDPERTPVTHRWRASLPGQNASGDGPLLTLGPTRAGNGTLSLFVTDADGMTAVQRWPLRVDDGLVLSARVTERQGPAGTPHLEARVLDDRGRPIEGARVRYAVTHEARGMRLASGTLTTDADGWVDASLGSDLCVPPYWQLPGPHRLDVLAWAPSRPWAPVQETERDAARLRYHVGPGASVLAEATPVVNALPRDPLFGGIERFVPELACGFLGPVPRVTMNPV